MPRSAGIHAILSTQSLSDIEKKGGTSLVGQILNNCNNYFIYRQNNHADAEMLANLIGTQDTHQITSQLDSKIGSTGAGTVRQTKEFIIHPDEIKRLELSRAIVVNKRNFQVHNFAQRLNEW
jgi:type IV secretory pathway TraG/TraD family ATPase VirD4